MKSPFPITVNFVKEGAGPLRGHIMKMTTGGMLVKFIVPDAFKMGDKLKAAFNLRGFEHDFNEAVTVVKSYFSFAIGPNNVKTKVQLVEMHFVEQDFQRKQIIEQFLEQFPEEK